MSDRMLGNIFVEVGVAVVTASAIQVGAYECLRSIHCSIGMSTVLAAFLWLLTYFLVVGVWNSVRDERKRR